MQILGIKIDNLNRKEIQERLKFFLSSKNKKFRQVCTVNPEFILQAQKDKEFREILNSKHTLNIADGIGLKFASWRQRKNLKCRWAGIDLTKEILKIANKNKQKIFLVANKDGLSSWQETAEIIREIYPSVEIDGMNMKILNKKKGNLKFKVSYSGKRVHQNKETLQKDVALPRHSNIDLKSLREYISNCKPAVVLCSLGAPAQEKLLYSLRNNDNIKLVMGVGGSFDFLTGEIKRAPKWLRAIGLEWLYRLIQEPSYRWRRIFRAVIIFPVKVLLKK